MTQSSKREKVRVCAADPPRQRQLSFFSSSFLSFIPRESEHVNYYDRKKSLHHDADPFFESLGFRFDATVPLSEPRATPVRQH